MYNIPHQKTKSVQGERASGFRSARSKHGCVTCRQRKVRCNEATPRCSHCQRLNLQCRWQPSAARASSITQSTSSQPNNRDGGNAGVPTSPYPPTPSSFFPIMSQVPLDGQFTDVFNYASFMWDGSDAWNGSEEWTAPAFSETGQQTHNAALNTSVSESITSPSNVQPHFRRDGFGVTASPLPCSAASQMSDGTTGELLQECLEPPDDRILTEYFIRAVVPPILVQVETQQKWSLMRQLLMSMFNTSSMVRHSILAFAELLFRRNNGSDVLSMRIHYDRAVAELAQQECDVSLHAKEGPIREHLLATLFFLSYIDLLEARIEQAHSSLKKAYDILQSSDKLHLRPVEVRLLCWIRLLDARAVSAGGQGLFLETDDESLLAYPSPSSITDTPKAEQSFRPEGEIEEVLFNALYQPGYIFFSKVQSFMGRVSKIDPWHRSRGTVEDETEVMSIASKISKDLNALYDSRPPLMDHAVSGNLTSQHVAAEIAVNITRAFRTYLSNYQASKIHLHRVAYKSLPLTSESRNAIYTIRRLARLMIESPESSDMLPVNMLWPLLMWGCEEEDLEERQWIKTQILHMENVATNAVITAHVLEEVQSRQDRTKQRVDVRTVMHEIFDSCFAIV